MYKLGSYLVSLTAHLAILHGERRMRPCNLMDHSSHKQAAADWTAVMACPRGTLVCLITPHFCGVLKLLFNYSSQMYHLKSDTLLNPRHTKRKQACYSQKREINLLLEIKVTLQAPWLCIGLIEELYSVFISKFQLSEIN